MIRIGLLPTTLLVVLAANGCGCAFYLFDPMTGVKWTRRTTDKIACELRSLGVNVSSKTVGRLLKQLGFSLRVNHKKLCGATSEDRDTQFACIAELRERFAAAGHPIISVDTKKRELAGLFKNGGQAWNREPTLVKDHDFRSESNGIAIPSCAKTQPF